MLLLWCWNVYTVFLCFYLFLLHTIHMYVCLMSDHLKWKSYRFLFFLIIFLNILEIIFKKIFYNFLIHSKSQDTYVFARSMTLTHMIRL